jgi:predicted signal transduction protein with EAL and GGDEF domain
MLHEDQRVLIIGGHQPPGPARYRTGCILLSSLLLQQSDVSLYHARHHHQGRLNVFRGRSREKKLRSVLEPRLQ